MPELQIDLAVANRFISSLSKSLQALCHGCMDFDSGIEIVGYININIDSGSKVDYVLNEKVLKSTTNSMTFVSNSFLAKKEQPKQTRDGACSPIPQPQVSPYTPRLPPVHLNSRFQKAGAQVSPYDHNQKGPQKRTRADDLNIPRKKNHFQGHSAESPAAGQGAHSHFMPSSASSSYPDLQSQQSDSASDTLQVNIKKEAFEADSQHDFDGEHSHNPSSDGNLDSSLNPEDKVQVKRDPDETNSGNNHFSSNDGDNTVTGESADFKSNFLEPSLNDSQQAAEESCNQSESHGSYVAGSETGNNDHSLADEANMPSTSRDNVGDTDVMSTENDPVSGVSVDYEKSVDDGSYYQHGFDDAGEGSNDAGQFEVIEIDDEDEDVQAMFSDHHSAHSSFFQPLASSISVRHPHRSVIDNATLMGAKHSRNKQEQSYSVVDPNSHAYKCPECGKVYKTSTGARLHFKIKHCGAFDHYCEACGKGFQQKSHLKSHMSLHRQQKDFVCNICGLQYAHKTSLTAHQKMTHGV